MKNFALIIGLLFISINAFAQEKSNVKRSDLTGPAYKNYKAWKHNTESTKVYTKKSKKALTGPKYKNYKPWRDASKVEYVVVNAIGNERQKLTGPAYKNYKPWRKK
ncbi:hypothetical protein [Seonamhaeicola marinus]|uniref:Uncharacterized protein n=1 Tax=Seonamhaeicola marinus TaxID=1912246 RepID=A0A5D0J967_9FLAO|nr:hypothetical protein [Seonamhaeicola marinus]TYA92099.1 hypothetical protein FUA24_01315 [Seonamhaeicola marinus]